MANSNFKVDVSPEMQLYKILQRQSYDIGTALAEFVDNSVQSFREKNTAIKSIEGPEPSLEIRIVISSTEKRIVIEDNAGGINRENFQRAIRMGYDGQSSPRPDSLSVYGIGMKSSAIWFSNKWSVETSALGSGEKLTTTFDLDQLLEFGGSTIEVESHPEDTRKRYTRIIITDCLRELRDPDKQFEKSVLPYLRETFYKFKNVSIKIEHDNLLLHTTDAYLDEPLPLVYPCVDKDGEKKSDNPVTWKKRLDFLHEGKKVKGFIMIMDTGSYHGPGIRLLRNQRVINGTRGGERQNKPGVLLGTANKYAAQRLYGEIKLNAFPVNFMKTGFDMNMDSLYRTIKKHISEVEEDFVQQATYYRKKKSNSGKTADPSSKPKPKPTDKIPFSDNLKGRLSELKFKKLFRLYVSLCDVSLINDPVLAYVGAWTLLESLASHMGKDSNTAFDAFYNGKINNYVAGKEKSTYKTVISDIHKKGNMNKHSAIYETMNAEQLASDFPTIEKFLVYCVELALKEDAP